MIIETKLNVPETKGVLVNRAELFERLNEGLKTKLTLVTAPAGYGKSTLLSEWVKLLKVPVAWVSYDEYDNDPIRFWRNTVESLRMVSESFQNFSMADVEHDSTGKAFVATFINYVNRLSNQIVLIWDDFHLVDNEAVVESINYFFQYVPDSVHVYITSRTQPSLALSRMRMEGALLELHEHDLRFGLAETAQFFANNTDLIFDEEELIAILEKTEGWVAGLRIVTLLMKQTDQADAKEVIAKISGSEQHISSYFLEEIFQKETPEMQQFLVKTSILNRMNVDLINRLTELETGGQSIREVMRENLFIISLDDRQTWYRYHHLFQRFLQQKLRELFPGKVKWLHRVAGEGFQEQGYLREAISHFLEGEQYEQALDLLEEVVPTWIQTDAKSIYEWLEKIPDMYLMQRPILLMNGIFASYMMGEIAAAEGKIVAMLASPIPDEVRGSLEMLRVVGAYFAEEYETFIELSEAYVATYPEADNFIHLEADGDLNYPKWTFMGVIPNLREREQIIRRAIKAWSKTKMYSLVAKFYTGLAEIMYEWNRLDEAEAAVLHALELVKVVESKVQLAHGTLILEKVYVAKGRMQEADGLYKELCTKINQKKYPQIVEFMETYHTYLLWMRGEMNGALRWLPESGLEVTDSIPETMLLEYNLFAVLLAEQGKREQAIAIISHMVAECDREERLGDYIRLLMQYSIFLAEADEMASSMDALEEALFLAERHGYLRTLLDGGPKFREVLQDYETVRKREFRRQLYHVNMGFVENLLRQQYGGTWQELDNVYLTEKELHVLQLLTTSLSNKEIAAELGVSLSTIKTHINHIYQKLQARNRMEAIEIARQLQLLPWN